ncbi:hypothetical protein NLG97_g992 [Lecanicillium saksenae]|uniref:Uncharacterized protein n=1 Tax=Lecanicillium saksenae TaxID=468837 RepID=A0ACC1R518_9HYPO|nr:hypothetical protein NLG97_g992 [Lecanicillium saksenae]
MGGGVVANVAKGSSRASRDAEGQTARRGQCGCAGRGDEGYVDSNTFIKAIKGVEAMNLPNYGGAMLWEAQLSVKNGNYAKKIRSSL